MSDVLDELFTTVLDRQAGPTPGSYTAKLLAARGLTLADVEAELVRRRR